MASVKLSAKTEQTAVHANDLLPIVDSSDTTDGLAGTSKKIKRSNLVSGLAASGANSDITSLSGLTTPLSVAQGGSGAATVTGILKGNGTAAFTAVAAPAGAIVGTTDTQTLTNKVLSGNTAATLLSGTGTLTLNTSGTVTVPSVTDTLVGKATTDTLTNKTLTAPVISSIVNTGTLTLPTSTDTLVGRATTDTLTNKTLTTPTLTKPVINGSAPAITTDTDGATITFDLSASDNHTVTLGGNRTLAISNMSVGQKGLFDLAQDGTGSRTVTWFHASSNTVTMTIATPCVVTSGTDIPTTTPIIFTTTGALPTGLTASTTYYWVRVSATTGNVASSIANAQAGTVIATSGSQSGVHTMTCEIRWSNGGTAPTLSTGKYRHDTFGIWYVATNVMLGFILGQNT